MCINLDKYCEREARMFESKWIISYKICIMIGDEVTVLSSLRHFSQKRKQLWLLNECFRLDEAIFINYYLRWKMFSGMSLTILSINSTYFSFFSSSALLKDQFLLKVNISSYLNSDLRFVICSISKKRCTHSSQFFSKLRMRWVRTDY